MGAIMAFQGIHSGVGTSSVLAGLAWALRQLDEKVLVIDLSPTNALRLHFNMPFSQNKGWCRGVLDHIPWKQTAMRYMEGLDFLPFGHISVSEQQSLETRLNEVADFWQENLAHLTQYYPWILIDLPPMDHAFSNILNAAIKKIMLLNVTANNHIRLQEKRFLGEPYFLINRYCPASQLQHDINLLWRHTIAPILPLTLHQDEALAEAAAFKQPVGEYAPHSLIAEELLTLANWCLAHFPKHAHEIYTKSF